jgi:hypothetical protein
MRSPSWYTRTATVTVGAAALLLSGSVNANTFPGAYLVVARGGTPLYYDAGKTVWYHLPCRERVTVYIDQVVNGYRKVTHEAQGSAGGYVLDAAIAKAPATGAQC